MWTFAVAVSLVLLGTAIVAVISPARVFRYFRAWIDPAGIAAAAALRLAYGAALVLAAPDSAAGAALKVLGALTMLAAPVGPMLGVAGLSRMLVWQERQPASAVRAVAALVAVLAVWILYVLLDAALTAYVASIGAAFALFLFYVISG